MLVFLDSVREEVLFLLREDLQAKRSIRWDLVVTAVFSRRATNGGEEYTTAYLRSHMTTTLTGEGLETQLQSSFQKVKKACENFENCGSGWVLDKVLHVEINTARYLPLAPASYIPLPKWLCAKKAIVNVKNSDNKCFLWSVLAALHPVEQHSDRVSNYRRFEGELDTRGLVYPVTINQIHGFEMKNDVTVNVFALEGKEIFPVRITAERKRCHVNLLLIKDADTSHYCLIRSMSRLFSVTTKHDGQSHFCDYCLQRFSSADIHSAHVLQCKQHGPQKVTMPGDGDAMMFKNISYQLRVPYAIYADFEAVLPQVQGSSPDPATSHTVQTSLHRPCGFSYVVVGPDGVALDEAVVYRGEDCVDVFFQMLLQEEEAILRKLRNPVLLRMSEEDERRFQQQHLCAVCNEPLGIDRVRDHCHVSGDFRAALHAKCNLQLKMAWHIPVIFHNLQNYDAHFLMQGLGKIKERRIQVIGRNMEKFISFSLGRLRFLDSCQFLTASLDTLVKTMKPGDFVNMHKTFGGNTPLLLRKGVYPYEYMDSFSKFSDPVLPPIEAFYTSLGEENITDSDYDHAKLVWAVFNMRTMGDYHDLYVKTDVVLLADVFESFRRLCMENYSIDPCHTYTSPGLAWNACLKMTDIQLELISDPDMHLFFERGVRGGVSVISKRYSRANNPHVPGFNPGEKKTWIMYWDVNNLYGKCMMEHLPVSDFRWMEEEEVQSVDFLNISDDADKGYMLEVDLEYPWEIHDNHNDFPLAAENIEITGDMYSDFMKEQTGDPSARSCVKLSPNLRDKEAYVLHYRCLKQYVSLGMRLKGVRRAVEFTQRPWLRPYIAFNTEKRKGATGDFEKDFYKLMNNAVYGKSLENVRKHADIRLVHNKRRSQKLVASPAFESFKIINDELVVLKMKKINIKLDRPLYTGVTILDLSKHTMVDFHYNYVKVKYGDDASLLFTDTDSFCYEISTDDIYLDMLSDIHRFDTSNYPCEHFLFSDKNKKSIGAMKDENGSLPVIEFCGLRSKMYSMITAGAPKMTAKGVVRSVVRKHIKHEHYLACLRQNISVKHNMPKILSRCHQLQSVVLRKTTLCPRDNKRYILGDGINTLAYGHYSIQ